MAWVHYTLRFRLLSPLHIGYRKVGNLMQTRSYVPGKVLWGALTARLTRDLGQGADGRAYQNIGKQVQDHFRFGYLWPSLDGQRLYLPWEQDDFDYLLLGSYASTALDYDRQAAEEGSLHETEFIAPVARDGRPVYLLGDLWVRDNLPPELENWRKALGRVQLGGERAYGWGRVRLESDLNAGSQSSTTVAGYSWEERADEVVICLLQGARACAHVLAAGSDAVREMVGPVEVLVGWEMNPAGGFQISQQPLVCWAPGSSVRNLQGLQQLEVLVGPFGVWKKG